MTLETIFWLAHVPAALGWAALLLPSRRRHAGRRIAVGCGAAIAVLYAASFFSGSEAAGLLRDYSLAGVAAFFDVPRLQLAGWLHYLVLDLWAGIWQTEEAERAGMRPWPLRACLLSTMMIAPAGLLLFLLLRRAGGSPPRDAAQEPPGR
jgi:hypothetical protein